jgi:hypothetical protein
MPGRCCLGGWLQSKGAGGAIEPWVIFLLTDLPPLFTAWWDYVSVTVPPELNPLPDWSRYQWFWLITGP